jgi:hypothetical protein
MTRNFRSAILAGTTLAVAAFAATGAQAATAPGTATANIVQALTIAETEQLDFATIVPSGAAATVQVNSAGSRTCGGGLTCSGTTTAGAFTATGTPNQSVTISTDATATLTSGANNMSVSGIAPSAATGTLSAGGTLTFTVGGTLNVGASQAAGVYSGSYNVNVNYQ